MNTTFNDPLSLAIKYHLARKSEEARKAFLEIIENNPNCAESMFFLGVISIQDEDKDKAESYFQKSLKINSLAFKTWFNLGNLYEEQGKISEALVAYKQAISLKPDFIPAYNKFAQLLQKTQLNTDIAVRSTESARWENVINYFRQMISIKPDSVQAYYSLAFALQEQGKQEEAFSYYQQSLANYHQLSINNNQISVKQKLQVFNPVYWLNINRNSARKQSLEKLFAENNIRNTRVLGYDASEIDVKDLLINPCPKESFCTKEEFCVTFGHLKAIQTFWQNSNDDLAIIAEDDLCFDNVKNWTFTWQDLLKKLPHDWDVIQLTQIRPRRDINFQFHFRALDEFSTCCYLIKRQYAQKICQTHIREDKYYLNAVYNKSLPNWAHADQLIFNSGKTYSFPILNYRYDFGNSVNQEHHLLHKFCADHIIDTWSKNIEIFTLDRLVEFNN